LRYKSSRLQLFSESNTIPIFLPDKTETFNAHTCLPNLLRCGDYRDGQCQSVGPVEGYRFILIRTNYGRINGR